MHPDLKRLLHKDLRHLVPTDLDRQNSFGGTDAPIICGKNQYTNPYHLYQRKLGQSPPVEMNDKMEWGIRNEDAIIKKFGDNHPDCKIYRPKVDYPGVIMAPAEHVWDAHSSPDAIGKDKDGKLFIIEAKSTDKWAAKAWGDSGSQVFPLMHRYQVQWYMWICRLDYAYISVLIGGNDYREYRVDYNPALVDSIKDKVSSFHSAILNRTPPLPTSVSDMADYLLETRGDDYTENFVPPEQEHKDIVSEIFQIDSKKEKLEEKKEKLKNKLKDFIKRQDAKGIECEDFKVTWSTGESSRIPSYKSYSSALEKHVDEGTVSDLKTKFTVTSVNERLTVNKKSGKKGGKK